MRLELYQAETSWIAKEQTALLDEAQQIQASGKQLSRLEQNGVLHALQVLIENSIGKAKHMLKATNEPVPVSAYDAFDSLARRGEINSEELRHWNSAIGLRNRIVHDYMNIDMALVLQLISKKQYGFLSDFLCKAITNWQIILLIPANWTQEWKQQGPEQGLEKDKTLLVQLMEFRFGRSVSVAVQTVIKPIKSEPIRWKKLTIRLLIVKIADFFYKNSIHDELRNMNLSIRIIRSA